MKDAVVFLEGSEKSSPMPKARIVQRDKTFIPHVIVVTKGTFVEFPNQDAIYHNVFAHYRAAKFDLGTFPQGVSRGSKFDIVGSVSILCGVHPDMSAYVYVVDTPFFALTGRDGKFRISGVPQGSYNVVSWHESGKGDSRTLNLQQATDLSLDLHR
jgi:plastocyanin